MPLSDDVTVRRRSSIQSTATQLRRAQILDAATEAFIAQGYNATSLRDVAGRAGLSHTGLLHHYPDKAALLEAVLDDRLEGVSTTVPLDAADGETFLRALLELAARDVQNPATIRLVSVLGAEAVNPGHPAHGYFVAWYALVRQHLTRALDDLDRRGLYRAAIPTSVAALHLLTMRDGLNLQWLLSPGGVDLVETIRAQFRLYVDVEL
ncbi:TetR/AcrR family transcriptional regulator [Subtercola sp. YIM 133946]|uniref:TetR/AcrR family transcriptional regulator n=1 Tax=Subtercola sp. YIM 133946 TaxID=3118909 RepID=UPI002F92C55E